MIKYLQNCRLCNSPHLEEILNLGEQNIQGTFYTKNNHYPPKRKIPNVIVRCDPKKGGCSLVQSNLTVPPEILFSSYFYKSGTNEMMRSHLKSVVDKLLQFDPNPKKVLDIASNDNTLLLNYPKTTEKWGIDPNNIAENDKENNITVINDFFPTKQELPSNIDYISALAVMYDLDSPLEFVKSVFDILSGTGIFCFEVMYLPSIINSLAWDTFLFEHLTHWSLFSIEKLIKMVGGKLTNACLTTTNGGSILVFATHEQNCKYDSKENKDRILMLKKIEFDMGLDDQQVFVDFKNRVQQHQRDLKSTLQKLKNQGKKICLYGCSTKSNVIVQGCSLEEYFDYGIERSEEKVGGKTLWGLPIKSEEEARNEADQNTVWFLGPYFFKESIVSREQGFLNKGGSLLFPLPQILVYSKLNQN